jgi:tripartite ATP-independent transporter DctM subunit
MYRPSWGGEKVKTSWGDRIRCLPDLLPPILLFAAVVGSIYGGVATPTEAASIGVCMAIVIAAVFKSLNIKMLKEAFEGTMRTTAMIMLIVFAAIFLNFVLGMMGITQAMLEFISDLCLTPVQTVLLIIVFYLFLGMFMETLSMMLTTVPIVFPIIMALGVPEFSDVWFGILITLLMEAALITPPIGVNLYVVHGIRMRGGHFNDVAIGAIPFLIAMLVMILLLVAYPNIATWLPTMVYH